MKIFTYLIVGLLLGAALVALHLDVTSNLRKQIFFQQQVIDNERTRAWDCETRMAKRNRR